MPSKAFKITASKIVGTAVKACCFRTQIRRTVADRPRRLLSQIWATSTMETRRYKTCFLNSIKLSTMQSLAARMSHWPHQTSLRTKKCQLRCSWYSAVSKRILQAPPQKLLLSETSNKCSRSPIRNRNSQQQKRRGTSDHLVRSYQEVSLSQEDKEEGAVRLFLLGRTYARPPAG